MHIADDPVHGLGKVLDVLGGKAGNADPPVVRQVDVEALLHDGALGLAQAGIREHPDLADDVLPAAGCLQAEQLLIEGAAHGLDPGDHRRQVRHPLGVERRVVEDAGDDPRSKRWWVANECSLELAELAADSPRLLRVPTNRYECPAPFVVQPKVLRVGLGHEELQSRLHKVADSVGVVVKRSGGKALVRTVKDDNVPFRFKQTSQLVPLLPARIAPSRIVCTGMQHKH